MKHLTILPCKLLFVQDAANRYAKYWEMRRMICNSDEMCYRKLTLDDGLQDDALALSMGLCQLLPPNKKDPSGRSIIFMDSSRQDHSKITVRSQARAAAYMAMAALEDEETQRKGLVVIFWPAKERWDQPNREFITLMGKTVKGALPIRLSGAHICQPPAFIRLVLPLVKMAMGERLRKRILFHTGSCEDVQKTLEPYGLTKDILPTELGGDVVLDQDAWLAARRQEGL